MDIEETENTQSIEQEEDLEALEKESFLNALNGAEDDSQEEQQTEDDAGEGPAEESAEGSEEGVDEDDAETIEMDRFQELENRISSRMRKIEGHFGGLKSQLQAALEARNDTKEDGGEAPTKKQIKAASRSTEKLNALKETFPEWGEALEEQVDSLEQEFSSKLDSNDVPGMIESSVSQMAQEMHERIKVYAAYPRWETIYNSEEFTKWKEVQPEDIQVLEDSPYGDDAVKMLDAYHEHIEREKKSESEKQHEEDKKEVQTKKRQRLASAVQPTKGKVAPASREMTEEEAFLAAVNS